MSVDLSAVKQRFDELAAKIAAPPALAVFPEGPLHYDGPHVQSGGDRLAYFVTERGIEFERRTTKDADELLYWLLRRLTFEMACEWERRHRREGEDFRRQLSTKQVELLARLKAEWGVACAAEHRLALAKNPDRDRQGGNSA